MAGIAIPHLAMCPSPPAVDDASDQAACTLELHSANPANPPRLGGWDCEPDGVPEDQGRAARVWGIRLQAVRTRRPK
jgi:hypothetical protein